MQEKRTSREGRSPQLPYLLQRPPNYHLKQARLTRGLTQAGLAAEIGTTDQTVLRWENGISAPTPYFQHKLCEYFGTSPEALGLRPGWPTPPGPSGSNLPPVCFDPAAPLPLASTRSMVGRAALLARLKERLLVSGLLALCGLHGLPGVGKTALAVALAHDPEVQAHFADGMLWAGLGPQPNVPAHLARWAGLLGLSLAERAAGSSQENWGEALRAAIGQRRLLIVLDDAWRIEDALDCKVGGPRTCYLLTTRMAALALQFAGEKAAVVPELEEEDGLALLAQLAPTVVATEREEARRLVRAVGGLPLALTLLGSDLERHAKSGPPRRLHAALERFQHAEARLRVAEPLSPLERPPHLVPGASLSLQASIAVSVERLDEVARGALHALSVFPPKPNNFSEEAALAVAQVGTDVLDRLVDGGLLELGGDDRYQVHQTIADYALFQASDPGVGERLVAYMVTFVEDHARDPVLLEQESANVLAALEVASEHNMLSVLIRMVNTFSEFLTIRGLYDLEELHLARAEHAARELGDKAGLIAVLHHRGIIAQKRGNYEHADICLREGLVLAQQDGQPTQLCRLLSDLGKVKGKQGQNFDAKAYLETGLTLARQHGLSEPLCDILSNLGITVEELGNYALATSYYQEGLALARQIGDPERTCRLLINLGVLENNRGNHARAESYFQEALALARQVAHREWICLLTTSLGTVAYDLKDYAKSEALLLEGLQMARDLGHREYLCYPLMNLGTAAGQRGDRTLAESYFREALQVAGQIGNSRAYCLVLVEWGELLLNLLDIEAAEQVFQQLKESLAEGAQELLARAQFGLARVEAAAGNLSLASELGRESLGIFESLGHDKTKTARDWLASLPDVPG